LVTVGATGEAVRSTLEIGGRASGETLVEVGDVVVAVLAGGAGDRVVEAGQAGEGAGAAHSVGRRG
jgi:hypothetical protein